MGSRYFDGDFARQLLKAGLVTETQIGEALGAVEAEKLPLGDVLVRRGLLTAAQREDIERRLQAPLGNSGPSEQAVKPEAARSAGPRAQRPDRPRGTRRLPPPQKPDPAKWKVPLLWGGVGFAAAMLLAVLGIALFSGNSSGQPPETAANVPDPPPKPRVSRQEVAMRALEEVRRFEGLEPNDVAGRIRMLGEFVLAHPDTSAAEVARARMRHWESRLEPSLQPDSEKPAEAAPPVELPPPPPRPEPEKPEPPDPEPTVQEPPKPAPPPPPKVSLKDERVKASDLLWDVLVGGKERLVGKTMKLPTPTAAGETATIKDVTNKGILFEQGMGRSGSFQTELSREKVPIPYLFKVVGDVAGKLTPQIHRAFGILLASGACFDMALKELKLAEDSGEEVEGLRRATLRFELDEAWKVKDLEKRFKAVKGVLDSRGELLPEDMLAGADAGLRDLDLRIRRECGPYATRFSARAVRLTLGGGSEETEDVVLAALKWLSRHQNLDGSWGVTAYAGRCGRIDGLPGDCTPNPGFDHFDAGVTGLAVLAFLGSGYTPLSKETHDGIGFGEVVRKGLRWMMDHQGPAGCIGNQSFAKHMYNHLICAMALSEAYGMTGSDTFKKSAQKAVDFILTAQNRGKGWRYSAGCGDNDSSVTGWAVMALKSAEMSGFSFPPSGYKGALAWFDEVTKESDHRVGYTARGTGKVFSPGINEDYSHHEALAAIAMTSRIFMGKRKSTRAFAAVSGKLLLKDPPDWNRDEIDFYYWYHATVALFQYDGPSGDIWARWNEKVKEVLVPNQVRGSTCKDGCWETLGRWCMEAGRVYATALNAMTLEVYYRYPTK